VDDAPKMLDAGLFRKLGLFVDTDFLGADTCARIAAETRVAASTRGIVVGSPEVRDKGGAVDITLRKVWDAEMSASTTSEISARLENLRPTLERHFKVCLSECEGPRFLRYEEGGFHLPHRDSRPTSPPDIRRRAVSVVIFLNRYVQDPVTDGFGGGELCLYGLIDDPKWEKYGFPIKATPGLLVAYRSGQKHEIKPVKFGQRLTIVAWFLGP
jgi:predicted 2-oxoglutarate/Fe(II)-dependent dioxygenase YbiX